MSGVCLRFMRLRRLMMALVGMMLEWMCMFLQPLPVAPVACHTSVRIHVWQPMVLMPCLCVLFSLSLSLCMQRYPVVSCVLTLQNGCAAPHDGTRTSCILQGQTAAHGEKCQQMSFCCEQVSSSTMYMSLANGSRAHVLNVCLRLGA